MKMNTTTVTNAFLKVLHKDSSCIKLGLGFSLNNHSSSPSSELEDCWPSS